MQYREKQSDSKTTKSPTNKDEEAFEREKFG